MLDNEIRHLNPKHENLRVNTEVHLPAKLSEHKALQLSEPLLVLLINPLTTLHRRRFIRRNLHIFRRSTNFVPIK